MGHRPQSARDHRLLERAQQRDARQQAALHAKEEAEKERARQLKLEAEAAQARVGFARSLCALQQIALICPNPALHRRGNSVKARNHQHLQCLSAVIQGGPRHLCHVRRRLESRRLQGATPRTRRWKPFGVLKHDFFLRPTKKGNAQTYEYAYTLMLACWAGRVTVSSVA